MPIQTAGNPQSPLFGVAAEFDSARDLFHAAEQMRDAGFTRFDVFSPFPIHGMDAAMGLKRSVLGKIIFLGGLMGFLAAVTIQFVPSSIYLPAHRHGQADQPFYGACIFPDHVRIHGAHLGLHGSSRNAHHERAASVESPDVQLGKVSSA